MKIVILTKTNWNEAPRIRHQLTRLLKSDGHAISFVEKNTFFSTKKSNRTEEDINFYSHNELIHHQLRVFPFIQKLNNTIVKNNLSKVLENIEFDVIINFHYDYSFLKTITNKPIITFINDDFIEQGKVWMKRAIKNQLKKTCENSDIVLTVSYPLLNQLKAFNANTKLFFPWAQKKYKIPKNNLKHKVLYYGYISRLNWGFIEEILIKTKYNFDFIGPIVGKESVEKIKYFKNKYSNFNHIGFTNFKDLNPDEYFCSILPYDSNISSVQACTISNRAFNLLSLGLPLVYADLKDLIKTNKNVIRKNATVEEYIASLNYFEQNFQNCQKDIQTFLNNHYQENRLDLFNTIIEDIKRLN